MDQNESTTPSSTSNSRPISPSPVTVGEGTNVTNKKRDWPKIYGRDARGKFLSKDGTQTKRSEKRSRGDMSMPLRGGDFTPHIFTVHKGEDIIEWIMSFTGNGSRGITVLSAIGTVANVKIQPLDHPAMS